MAGIAIAANPTTPPRSTCSEPPMRLPWPFPVALGWALPELDAVFVVPVVAKGAAPVVEPVADGRGAFPVGAREFACEEVRAY